MVINVRANRRLGAFFAWGVWFPAVLGAILFVAFYGRNVPFSDDFNILAFLVGDQEITPAWLWEQYVEHRIPLPKLVLIALFRLSGGDFRAVMVFNVFTMAALAFGMIWTAKRLRGWTSYADAFFPLTLLHGGHYYNFLWAFVAHFFLVTGLAGVVLLLILRKNAPLRLGPGVLFFVCLVLLSLCGSQGLLFVPPSALWLGYAGWLQWRSRELSDRYHGRVLITLALAALLLVPLYFIGYAKNSWAPPSPGLRASLRTGIQFLSMGFGFQARGLVAAFRVGRARLGISQYSSPRLGLVPASPGTVTEPGPALFPERHCRTRGGCRLGACRGWRLNGEGIGGRLPRSGRIALGGWKKQGRSSCNRLGPVPESGCKRHNSGSVRRSGTDGLFASAHPFGSLATIRVRAEGP